MDKNNQGKESETMSREIVPAVERTFNIGIEMLKAGVMVADMLFYYKDNRMLSMASLRYSNRADRVKAMDKFRLIARKMKADRGHPSCPCIAALSSRLELRVQA